MSGGSSGARCEEWKASRSGQRVGVFGMLGKTNRDEPGSKQLGIAFDGGPLNARGNRLTLHMHMDDEHAI